MDYSKDTGYGQIIEPRGKERHYYCCSEAPVVLEEFRWLRERPTSGPVIVSEYTGFRYTASEFRRNWQIVATAAGVPENVLNRTAGRTRLPPRTRQLNTTRNGVEAAPLTPL